MKKSVGLIILWIIAGLSLAINIVLVIILLGARAKLMTLQSQAATFMSELSSAMGTIKEGTFDYTVNIDQDMPIKGEIPISFVVEVPIKTTIPVSTNVSVPVSVPYAGTVDVSVPIRANVPVDMTVQVPIEQIIPIDITVPIKITVPISIKVADTPLAQSLTDIQAALERMVLGLAGTASPAPSSDLLPTP